MTIWVLNPGSSSLKFGLYAMGETEAVLFSGMVERIGQANATLRLTSPVQTQKSVTATTIAEAAHLAFTALQSQIGQDAAVEAIGCRVVHGGSRFVEPTRMTDAALKALSALDELAPLHNRAATEAMSAVRQLFPDAPLFAVFDTAFHRTLPDIASTYALPFEMTEREGLRRYGFHGISHRYVSVRLRERLNLPAQNSRLITCHLGSGASVCALRDGVSVDTSMGFTPLEGLMMGTRSGDLDPGLVLHLLRTGGRSAGDVDHLLNQRSGLLGVSGISSDVRELEAAESDGNPRAHLALEMFAYRVSKYIGAYAAVLEGVDAIAFAGGIGEHSASLRSRICRRLGFLGVNLEDSRNQDPDGSAGIISDEASRVTVAVIPTQEELQIAREVFAALDA